MIFQLSVQCITSYAAENTVYSQSASNAVRLYADNAEGKRGETVSIPVKISGNSGIMGFGLKVTYDKDAMTPVSVNGAAELKGCFDNSISTSKTNSFEIFWAGSENMTFNGVIFTVSFRLNENASGDYKIGLTCLEDDTFDESWNTVNLVCEDVKVTARASQTEITPSESDGSFVVSNVKALRGKTADVTVSVKNNPGIIAAKLNISYDTSKLKLIKVTNGTVMGGSLFDAGNNLAVSPYSVCWNDTESNHTNDGVMVTFTFEIAENAQVGVTPVTLTYDKGSTFNSELSDISFSKVNGSVEITDRTPGDANEDGETDLKDVVVIRRHLSGGWDVVLNEPNADVNRDGCVDLKDVVILRRYLSGGWDITLE